ncbi:acetyl-CoA carboxylase carboxyl transferase subunit alpha [Priestia endophytica]|jgi:acetyl-CoA carboxylase carboxyl transferase subunit alpha|uniref:acetyl-CoA carboxylase carboxyl transferase subunit alpha n=1 Tax=Priestia endophytica TaxID=135735 RepID=UPI000DCA6B27|nr:acetyl-CoA carboxylase carboxyl transferase subunit alpha [Priestia endophytica]MED4070833.1 acetyl-CoA carboxylase carboxyl transferase subunit alpha [Priestia endophytica]RAS88987.1 acetyl-CoA carboxylase carboxyl transferase subunit alpha [Priestia endophytica]RPK16018.1 Acetyl-coenzyme A carboxyl transferase alpha chain [Priestia endophytica]
MAVELEFERPVVELRNKIQELKNFAKSSDVDLSGEVSKLEERLKRVEHEIYDHLAPWDRVQIARHAERPTTADYIEQLFTNFFECHGDRLFGEDEAIIGGIAKFHGLPVTVIGHQRGKDTKENLRRNFGMPHPEGYRKALRLMKQAEKFNRPIITFVDTKGAYPGKAAEERGQSEAIAKNLMEMAGFTVPIISVVIGEGGSGGAIGLGLSNHLHMLENSTYSVISPEGAAALLWKDSTLAKKAAETMRITAPDLKELGVIDDVIEEIRGGAHRDVVKQAQFIDATIKSSLLSLRKLSKEELVNQRYEKYREIGEFLEEQKQTVTK